MNGLIEDGEYGRLFAVVHFASRQWKVTNEDLILIESHIDAACGDRIRMEKVISLVLTQISVQLTEIQGRGGYASSDRRSMFLGALGLLDYDKNHNHDY